MYVKNIILGLLGISLVITVHELGHWSMSQAFGVDTPRFSIGFGPVLLEKKVGQTVFTLSALPIGGYVEIAGMRTPELTRPQHSFINKPFEQQMLIMLGGIIFNILFACILFIFVGFRPPIRYLTQEEPEQQTKNSIVGPLGIIALASKSASYGIKFYFFFLAILSANLAVFNLLPIPILDGGQLLIQIVERIQGYQIQTRSYSLIMTLSTFFILALFIYSTARDIKRTV
jgi:regulator of sigma E protease